MVQEPNRSFLATVKIGPKGQIVIPKEVRDMFGIEPGDSLVLMADAKRGIAMQTGSFMQNVADQIFRGSYHEEVPEPDQATLEDFAAKLRSMDGGTR